MGNSQNAGVLGVDGEGGTTEAAGEDGGNAAGEYRAVQAGLMGKVLADDGADRHNITDVLQTGNDGAGGDEGDGFPAELGQGEGGNADPGGFFQGGEIHQAEGDGDEIAADQRDDDGHNAGKALGEVIDTNRDKEGDDGDGPVGFSLLHAYAGEGKAQYHDDGSNDDGREYAGYTVLTQDLEQQGKQQIKDCHAQNAALRIGDAHFANDGGNTGDDGEGAAQERGDHLLIDELIDDGADAGAEQGDGNIQTAENGNQNDAAHGQRVLETENGLLRGSKVVGKVAVNADNQFLFFFCHGIIPPQILFRLGSACAVVAVEFSRTGKLVHRHLADDVTEGSVCLGAGADHFIAHFFQQLRLGDGEFNIPHGQHHIVQGKHVGHWFHDHFSSPPKV